MFCAAIHQNSIVYMLDTKGRWLFFARTFCVYALFGCVLKGHVVLLDITLSTDSERQQRCSISLTIPLQH